MQLGVVAERLGQFFESRYNLIQGKLCRPMIVLVSRNRRIFSCGKPFSQVYECLRVGERPSQLDLFKELSIAIYG